MNLPDKMFLRRSEVREFLGVSEQQMTKLVEAETLKPIYLVKGGRAHFARAAVMELVQSAGKATEKEHNGR